MNDVLYLESDEEITSAIDKMLALQGTSVSIVVPKRSTLLQSIVNLKLLKKAAADAGKELVLVTGDQTATHLAARVGLPVAANLKSQPVLADVPDENADTSDIIEEDDDVPASAGTAAAAATFAPAPSKTAAAPVTMERKPLSMDPVEGAGAESSSRQARKMRVPNFDTLQKRLLIAGGVVGLLALLYFANFFIARGNVTLFAKADRVAADFAFTVDTSAKTSDPDGATLMGQQLSIDKEYQGTVPATGKKDVGTKAGGTMTINNSYDSSPHTLVAGTRFQSNTGLIFRSTADVTVPGAGVVGGGIAPGTAQVPVTADQNGDSYNLAPGKYTVVAYSGDMQTKIYGQGGQMSGGTTKEVTVVAQADIDQAKASALAKNQDAAQKELESKAAKDYKTLGASFASTVTDAQPSAAVGDEATNVTVTAKVAFSEVAVPESDYHDLIKAQVAKQIGAEKQVYDDGADAAKVTVADKTLENHKFRLTTDAFAGQKIDTDAIAAQLSGKRYSDAVDVAASTPGVDRAEIQLSPFWVSHVPKIKSHIKVTIKASDANG